jgi:predicted ABC-type ATPase
MSSAQPSRIYVLAGVNGAGKSSIGGATFREFETEYYNPDEVARTLMASQPFLTPEDANSAAWHQGVKLLQTAIEQRLDYAFETTLGGSTIPGLLALAASQGIEVYVWYIGLASPELHIERVEARASRGGHDIPVEDVLRRYESSRINLIGLLSRLTALRIYDNSADRDPAAGRTPSPVLVLHMERARILNPRDLKRTPNWAKPIVAAALKVSLG